MKNNKRKGFTIVELVIVIAVIAILAAVLIPTFSNITKKAEDTALQETLRGAAIEYTTKYASEPEYVSPDKLIYEYDGKFYELETKTGKYIAYEGTAPTDRINAIGYYEPEKFIKVTFANEEDYNDNRAKCYTIQSTRCVSDSFSSLNAYYTEESGNYIRNYVKDEDFNTAKANLYTLILALCEFADYDEGETYYTKSAGKADEFSGVIIYKP